MSVTRLRIRAMIILCGVVLGCAPGCDRKPDLPTVAGNQPRSESQTSPPNPAPASIPNHDVASAEDDPPESDPPPDPELLTRIGAALLASSPLSDGVDSRSHLLAAARLGKQVDLIDAGDEVVLWGGIPHGSSSVPPNSTLTRMVPMVLARAYLSLFAFSGEPNIRTEGDLRLLEVPATFRSGLEPAEYPEVLWHSEAKWRSYSGTRSILLVFKGDLLLSVLRREGEETTAPPPARWDGNWRWPSRDGREQPFASTFEWLLSEENPQRETLEEDYRILDHYFSANNCYSCHCPSPADGGPAAVVLNYPIQALAARRSLVAVIQGTLVPTGHAALKRPSMTAQTLVDITNAAAGFEGEADAALAYEAARRALP